MDNARNQQMIQIEEYRKVASLKFRKHKSLPEDVLKLQAIVENQRKKILAQQHKIDYWKSEFQSMKNENQDLRERIKFLQCNNEETEYSPDPEPLVKIVSENDEYTEEDLISYLKSLGNYQYRDKFGCNSKPENSSSIIKRIQYFSIRIQFPDYSKLQIQFQKGGTFQQLLDIIKRNLNFPNEPFSLTTLSRKIGRKNLDPYQNNQLCFIPITSYNFEKLLNSFQLGHCFNLYYKLKDNSTIKEGQFLKEEKILNKVKRYPIENAGTFKNLPIELTKVIVSSLDPFSYIHLGMTCKFFKKILNSAPLKYKCFCYFMDIIQLKFQYYFPNTSWSKINMIDEEEIINLRLFLGDPKAKYKRILLDCTLDKETCLLIAESYASQTKLPLLVWKENYHHWHKLQLIIKLLPKFVLFFEAKWSIASFMLWNIPEETTIFLAMQLPSENATILSNFSFVLTIPTPNTERKFEIARKIFEDIEIEDSIRTINFLVDSSGSCAADYFKRLCFKCKQYAIQDLSNKKTVLMTLEHVIRALKHCIYPSFNSLK